MRPQPLSAGSLDRGRESLNDIVPEQQHFGNITSVKTLSHSFTRSKSNWLQFFNVSSVKTLSNSFPRWTASTWSKELSAGVRSVANDAALRPSPLPSFCLFNLYFLCYEGLIPASSHFPLFSFFSVHVWLLSSAFAELVRQTMVSQTYRAGCFFAFSTALANLSSAPLALKAPLLKLL